ncbi:MAG: hypothetical protein JST48_04615 [Bacteroidetes bacterium]|nr:hypothetical protein [Bacteroidota bacterium]
MPTETKLKCELQGLEQLLFAAHPVSDSTPMLIQKIRVETDRVLQALALEVITLQQEDQVIRYIRYHQLAIARFMDKMGKLELTNKTGPPEFYQVSQGCLDELLLFVEHRFAKYFDQDAKAPGKYVARVKKITKEKLKNFRLVLTSKNADPRLIDLVLRILKSICDNGSEGNITFRKLIYAKEVQKDLSSLTDRLPEIKDIDEELRQVMYRNNYNSYRVLTYHAHYASSLLEEAETRAEKIEQLSLLLKKINQACVKPQVKYHPHGLPLKDQLNNYIVEELEYQQRLQLTLGHLSPSLHEPAPIGFKLKFTASVAQAAYLLRILMESKIILNNNLSQVFQFLAKYVVTKRSESVSLGSLRSKYYEVDTGTKESVRNMLMALAKYIDKN